jgi:hypothetical protein
MPSRTVEIKPGLGYDADVTAGTTLTIFCNSTIPIFNVTIVYTGLPGATVLHQGPILIPVTMSIRANGRITAMPHANPDAGDYPQVTYLQVMDE